MSEKDFKSIYYKFLNDSFDVIKQFEKDRKRLLIKACWVSFLFFIGALVLICFLCCMILKSIFNPFLFAILLFVLYVCLLKTITTIILTDRSYQQKFNEKILPLLLRPVANFKNWPKNKNTDVVIDSQIFPNFDTQEDVSCIFGYYKRSSITICDTRLTLPVKALEKPDLFKGVIIQFEVEKCINNHVILISKNENKNNKYVYFKTNIEGLDEHLNAFAKNNSDIEFLNEKFLNIIKKVAFAYRARSFSFSYKNNTVLIAMRQRKAMPFGYIFKSLVKLKNYDEFIEKFTVIYEFIDFLN